MGLGGSVVRVAADGTKIRHADNADVAVILAALVLAVLREPWAELWRAWGVEAMKRHQIWLAAMSAMIPMRAPMQRPVAKGKNRKQKTQDCGEVKRRKRAGKGGQG